MTFSLSPARAAASRRNGAKSQGPRTAQGKARSAKNALRHGLCAQQHVLLDDEDARAFAALEAEVLAELAPEGALQRVLACRIVRAAWRLERAERIETELYALRRGADGDLALALIRDGNGTRSFDTLMRYRGSAQAEFYRALRTLKELQAEAVPAPQPACEPASARPNGPEARNNPGSLAPPPRPADEMVAGDGSPAPTCSCGARSTRRALPNEPESRGDAEASPPDAGRRAA